MTQATGKPQFSADGRWWWDGSTWQPVATPPPPYPPGPAPAVDNSFAWALSFAPLIAGLLTAVLVGAGWSAGSLLGIVVAVSVNIALSTGDLKRIRAAGLSLPPALAYLLVPVYLFQRQARLRQNYAIPIVWCVSFLVSLAGGTAFGGSTVDTSAVQQQIQSQLSARTGENVTVTCPSVSVGAGGSFNCTAVAPDGTSALIVVTVVDSSGNVTWHTAQ